MAPSLFLRSESPGSWVETKRNDHANRADKHWCDELVASRCDLTAVEVDTSAYAKSFSKRNRINPVLLYPFQRTTSVLVISTNP